MMAATGKAMTKREAAAEARRRFGPTAEVRDRGWCFTKHYGQLAGEPRPRTSEERDDLRARYKAKKEEFAAHRAARPNYRTWPQDDTVANYRAAMDAFSETYTRLDKEEKMLEAALRDRYELVTRSGIFTEIRATGLTWDDLFANGGAAR